MFRSGFFTSDSWTINGDGFAIGNKAEGSDFLAKIMHKILGDGAAEVTTTGFQVVKKTGLTCTVKPFFVCKNGYFAWNTEDTDVTFTSSASEQVFYVGVRLDVATGEFTDDNAAAYATFVSATDVAAAKITITANAVTLTDGMIEDLRYDTAYCGQIDEYRERSLELIADAEEELAALQAAAASVTVETIGAMPKGAISSNLIINGGFNINQRAVSGTVTLASGAYGHDRWKGGASGGRYTFATSENVTTLTIASGKSIIQVVEGLNLKSGTVCLSWTGTAQGKIGAGEFGASGITGTAVGGTNLNIEFNAGTVSNVQLNYGAVALPFVPRPLGVEVDLCQRYAAPMTVFRNIRMASYSANTLDFDVTVPRTLRSNPTISGVVFAIYTLGSVAQTGFTFAALTFGAGSVRIQATKTGHGMTDAFLTVTTGGVLDSEI